MNKIFKLLILLTLLCHFTLNAQSDTFIQIPTADINVSEVYPKVKKDTIIKQESFNVSELITLGEYKLFLEFLENEYGEEKAQRYFPDSSIVLEVEDYTAYLKNTIYEKYPALGISWENVMAYCIWRSREDQLDSNHYYRLLNFTEYAAVRRFDSLNSNKKLVNEDYAEWSILEHDINHLFTEKLSEIVMFLFHPLSFVSKEEPQSMKRKVVFGDNFHFKRKNIFLNGMYFFYQNNGYHFVGFRLVIANKNTKTENYIHESMHRHYDYQ